MSGDGAGVERGDAAYAGQAVYSRPFLALYDLVAYGVNSPLLWRCRVDRIVALYDANVSGRHLDVGVGSGLPLDRCRFPVAAPAITLMDLNPNSLAVTSRRLERYAPRAHRANVLEPWGLPESSFDSVAMCHLLHCLPGTLATKAVAVERARAALAPGGTFFGATILGEAADHTWLSRVAIRANNRVGVLCNREDRVEDLDAALGRHFASHQIEVVGVVALFTARA